MAHEVTVSPSLSMRVSLRPSPDDLFRLLLRLDLTNLQVCSCFYILLQGCVLW